MNEPRIPSLSELVDEVLERFHEPERALLASLRESTDGCSGELRSAATMVQVLEAELTAHMLKEERILFPYLRQLDAGTELPSAPFGSVRNPILVMEHDHERALLLVAALKRACASASGALVLQLHEFCLHLEAHIRFEAEILFPRALAAERARTSAVL